MTHRTNMQEHAQRGPVGMHLPDDASEFEVLLATHTALGMPPLVLPGCWDVLSAAVITQAGYSAAWIGRGAVARATLGSVTPELVTARMMASVVEQVHDASPLVLVVEAGNGFGNAFNVARTVRTLEAAGAQGIQLDDDIGDVGEGRDAKRLTADMIGKLKAAVDAADHLVLIARTSYAPGESVTALVHRGCAYLEAGADLIAIGGTLMDTDLEQMAAWAATHAPLVIETDQPVSIGAFSGIAVISQPLLLQRQLEASAAGLLPPPLRAAVPLESDKLRRLAS